MNKLAIIGKVVRGRIHTIVCTENRIVGHSRPLHRRITEPTTIETKEISVIPFSEHDVLTQEVMLFANLIKSKKKGRQ